MHVIFPVNYKIIFTCVDVMNVIFRQLFKNVYCVNNILIILNDKELTFDEAFDYVKYIRSDDQLLSVFTNPFVLEKKKIVRCCHDQKML